MSDLVTLPMVRWSGVEGRPLVIAGPCSAESEAQVVETARRLQGARVDYLRAGIWKARTRPATFEGMGDAALPWLQRAGREYGMRTATEVATAAHVAAALRHGIDLLWIGARTTVNPFSVQEIAEALRGVTVPVLVKNPTSPDLGLWIGAMERINRAGVRALGVIHRGFSVAANHRYRNAPMWELAIEFRRLHPGIPIVTDPSHITGRRDLVPDIAQRAMDLGLDGLMIEVHPNPDQAWSDAAQQITPERLSEIIAQLKVRRADSPDADFQQSLQLLRDRIDHIDHDLIDLLARRMRVVEEIAGFKRDNNVATLQVSRWTALREDRVERAAEMGLVADYARALYEVIHRESLRRQSEIMNAEPAHEPVESKA
ncbi:MAG TPA: bifunctional 3-deoxy-7-phosphoheptulonate synthase/chorismate mutase type II [Gemmatimonadaceae bacterium]